MDEAEPHFLARFPCYAVAFAPWKVDPRTGGLIVDEATNFAAEQLGESQSLLVFTDANLAARFIDSKGWKPRAATVVLKDPESLRQCVLYVSRQSGYDIGVLFDPAEGFQGWRVSHQEATSGP
jgi:hypothetical protein